VVLLEAGPEHLRDRKEPYEIHSTGRPHKGVNEARVTAFGGATNIWGGGLIRMSESDLQPLPGMPDAGWPLDYAELSRHYDLVERDLGLPVEISADAGPFRKREMTVLPFWRKNFTRAFGPKLLGRTGVTIAFDVGMPEAIQREGGRMRSVEVTTKDGVLRVAARHFVVAAGVVNSILLARKLLTDVPADLGRFVHDHLSIPLYSIKPAVSGEFSRRFAYRFARGFMFAERYEAQGYRPGAFFHFTFEFSSSAPLAAIKRVLESVQQGGRLDWTALGRMILGMGTMARIALMRLMDGRLYVPADVKVVGVLDLEQVPDRAWRIGPRGNSSEQEMSWDIGKADIENATHHAIAVRQLLPSLAGEAGFSFKELFPDPEREPAAFEAYVRATAWDTYHCSGGLRMGADPANSMVTPSLALRGLENVHVVSTAVFPRAGTANPTLTLMALANRLATSLRITSGAIG
jgi:choline dehydrogenase-like flavoprotein